LLISFAAACGGNNSASTGEASVTTSPIAPDVRLGDPPLQFSAAVTGASNTAVNWSVNGVLGGAAANGTIDATGLYTPPLNIPANSITVQATLVANSSVMGASVVTLWNPLPVVSSVNPSTIGIGNFSIIVTGSKFLNGATVLFGGTALTTTFNSATQLTASGTASQAGSIVVTVETQIQAAQVPSVRLPNRCRAARRSRLQPRCGSWNNPLSVRLQP